MKYLIHKFPLPWAHQALVIPAGIIDSSYESTLDGLVSRHATHLGRLSLQSFISRGAPAGQRIFSYGIPNHIQEAALHVVLHFSCSKVWVLSTTNLDGGERFINELVQELVGLEMVGGVRAIPVSGPSVINTKRLRRWLTQENPAIKSLWKTINEPIRIDPQVLSQISDWLDQTGPLPPDAHRALRATKFSKFRGMLSAFYLQMPPHRIWDGINFAVAQHRHRIFLERLGLTNSMFTELVPLSRLLSVPPEVPPTRFYSLVGGGLLTNGLRLSSAAGGMKVRSISITRRDGQSMLDALLEAGVVSPSYPTDETARAVQEHPAIEVHPKRRMGAATLYERRLLGVVLDYAAVSNGRIVRAPNPGYALATLLRGEE